MQLKVLIVEDELIIARDIKDILSRSGYVITNICSSVAQAKESLNKIKPDLVLIDINLQGDLPGTEIGKFLLEKDKIPFVYITSYTDAKTIDDVKATRPMGYLVKPFKKIELLITVELALNNHQLKKIDPNRNEESITSEAPIKIRETIAYINNNLENKIELKTLALIAGVDVAYYSRIFKQHIGISPYQYILKRKIDRAKILLETTNIKISEIAFELGFQSHSNFTVAFNKLVEITPEDYRISKKLY
jgi:YesN/AraC family two-component response regulator